MKKAYLVILFTIVVSFVQAQINWGNYSQSFPDEIEGSPSKIGLILAIQKANNSFWVANENSKHFDVLTKDSSFLQVRSASNILARTTFDTSKVHYFLHGVNKTNAHKYQFRLTEYPGNRLVIPWTSIRQFTDSSVIKSSALPQMAYLGGYKTSLGKLLIMDVRKLAGNQIMATTLTAWEPIRPVIVEVYTSDNFDIFLRKLQYPWMSKDSDHQKQTSGKLKIPVTNANLIFLLSANIYDKNQVQYKVIRDGDIFIPWKANEFDNSFVWIKEYPPGEYILHIRYTVQPQHITSYRFEVEPAWYQSGWFRIGTGIFIAAFVGTVLFLSLFIWQRQKTLNELSLKTKLQLELKAIYAQLNPHFVFNALSSIQSLINKQDLKGANDYLSDFARLLRESLHNTNKDMISLYEEIQMMNTYLKLEQLRFGFHYQIHIGNDINMYDTSIPSLLLQPLIENAVKHGVASLHEKGNIQIHCLQYENSMKIALSDNGKGFELDKNSPGFGLKLTHDRIVLLNKLNKDQPIALEIDSNSISGTTITLIFNHWFL